MNYIVVSKEKSHASFEIDKIVNDLNISKDSIIYYDYEEGLMNQILDEANIMPLFDHAKVIVVDNVPMAKPDKKLLEYLDDPCLTTCLILIDYESDIKKITCPDQTKLINCNLSTDKFSYIKEYLKEYKIDSIALKYIYQISSDDLNHIKNELDKIMMYKWEEKEITIKDIEKIMYFPEETDVFKLIDYIVLKDSKKALKTYYELLNKEDPIKIITILANQIRLIYQIKSLSNFSNDEIAKELKVHPYRVKLGKEKARIYDENKLIEIIYALSDMDIAIKSGTIDKKEALENYIILLKE